MTSTTTTQRSGEGGGARDTGDLASVRVRLETTIRGALIHPGDDEYDAARAVYNRMIDRRPAALRTSAIATAGCDRFRPSPRPP